MYKKLFLIFFTQSKVLEINLLNILFSQFKQALSNFSSTFVFLGKNKAFKELSCIAWLLKVKEKERDKNKWNNKGIQT